MPDVKISALPSATAVGTADIFVLNQGGVTKTAAKSLITAGLATTAQIGGLNSAQVQALTSDQIAAITPATIGAVSTSDIIGISKGGTGATDAVSALSALGGITSAAISGFASTSQLSGFATTTQIVGIAFTSQLSAFATTSQISGFTNTAQVSAIASAQIAAITPASIGALSTDAASGFATTQQLTGYATTTQIAGIAFTSQLSGFATTEQISGFTNTAQVSAIASAQIAAITPAGIGAQIALTSAAPLAIDKGGTGAISTQAAISNLGIGMRMVEAQTTANIVGTMNTGVSPNTFTVTATGVFATDGYTPVLGDIIAFALQTTTTQNGFWEVTTVGAVGVSAVFTRPSWYTGTARNAMYMTRFGSAQNGFIQTFLAPLGINEITVGTTSIALVRVNFRTSPAGLGTNLFSAYQTFRANGASANQVPFFFQTGAALMSTPQGNAVEWFGDQMYLTTAAGVRTTNTTHVAVPATSSSAGLVGQIAVDNANNFLYVCTATNVWKRVLLATF